MWRRAKPRGERKKGERGLRATRRGLGDGVWSLRDGVFSAAGASACAGDGDSGGAGAAPAMVAPAASGCMRAAEAPGRCGGGELARTLVGVRGCKRAGGVR